MKRTFPLLIALVIATLPSPAGAAQNSALPQRDEVLVAETVPLPIYEATPDPVFGEKAAQIGWVKKGQSVKVLETKQYLSMFGMEVWVQVANPDGGESQGWVLVGMTQDIKNGQAKLSPPHAKEEVREPADEHPISRVPGEDE